MARLARPLGSILVFAALAALFADQPAPSADAVRKLQTLYRAERERSDTSGASKVGAERDVKLAEDLAAKADAALDAGRLAEAARKFRDARWHLPALPANLPPHVARVIGYTRLRHSNEINSLAFSPDGSTLASASRDRTVKLWDMGNGRELLTYRGHAESVRAVAFSQDGKRVASAGGSQIKLWEPATGKELMTLTGHTEYVTCLAFRPDGGALVSGGSDRSVLSWDLDSGKSATVGKQQSLIYSVTYSPNGKLIASANGDGLLTVYVHDGGSPREVCSIAEPHVRAYAVAFSADGKLLVSAGDRERVFAHVAPGPAGEPVEGMGTLRTTYKGHAKDKSVNALAFAPDGRLFVSGSQDESVRVWDLASGETVRTFHGSSKVNAVAFAPDGRTVASAGLDGSIQIATLEPVVPQLTFVGHTGPIWSAALSPDGKLAVTGGADRTARLWDMLTGREVHKLVGHKQPVTAVAFAPDGKSVISAGGDRTIRQWDATTGQGIMEFTGHDAPILGLAFRPDGKQFISVAGDRTARVWDVETGKAVATLNGHESAVCAAAVRADGSVLATGGTDGTVKLWALPAGTEIESFRAHEAGGVAALAFTANGQRLATCGADRKVRLWNTEQSPAREAGALTGHNGPLSALAIAPDGHYVVSAGSDLAVKVWDRRNLREVRSYRGHSDWVTAVAFAADGRSLLSAGVDGKAIVWAFASGDIEGRTVGHRTKIDDVAPLGNDGKRFLSIAQDQTLRLWDATRGTEVRTFIGPGGSFSVIAGSPDGRQVAALENKVLHVWDAATGKELHAVEIGDRVLAMNYANDSKTLVVATRLSGDNTAQHTVTVYDAETMKPLRNLDDSGRKISSVALSPDGDHVALGGTDGSVRVWNLTKNERVGGDLPVYASQAVHYLGFTPDGKQLLSTDAEGSIKVWRLGKHELQRNWRVAGGPMQILVVGPDGTRVATLAGATVELWDVATGQSLRRWEMPVSVGAIAFGGDGKQLIVGNEDATVYLLDLP